jgi:DNA-binding SARP family transcriptional activator
LPLSTGALFCYLEALSVSVFSALAVYLACDRSRRSANLPFVGLLLILAGESLADLLLSPWHDLATAHVTAGSVKWILVLFAFSLVLQCSARLLQNGWRRIGQTAAWTSTAAAAFTAVGVGAGGPAWEAWGAPMGAGPDSMAFSLSGLWFGTLSALVTCMLGRAALRARGLARRQEARHLFVVWLVVLGAEGAMLIAAGLASVTPQAQSAVDGVHRLAMLIAGGYLGLTVLRFGSPAGRPINTAMTPLVISTAASLVVLDALPLLLAPNAAPPGNASWMVPIVSGLVAGALLGEPRMARLAERWFTTYQSDRRSFTIQLRTARADLASGKLSEEQVVALRLRLQVALSAAYVQVVDRTRGPEPDQREATGVPLGPVALRRAIRSTGGRWAELLIGEPFRDQPYGDADRELAERFAEFLADCFEAGFSAGQLHPSRQTGQIQIRSFGGLRLSGTGNGHLPLRASQVLALLTTAYPDGVSADRLAATIWPDSRPDAARNNLHVALHALRRGLGMLIAQGARLNRVHHLGGLYQLELDGELGIDRLAFESAYQSGQRRLQSADQTGAEAAFQRAIELYRGPYLDNTALQLTVELEAVRHRLREQFVEMVIFVAERYVERDDQLAAEQALLRALEVEPQADLALQQLVRLYQSNGRHSKARAVEQRFARMQER